MTNESPAVQKRSRLQRVLRFLAAACLLAIVVGLAGHYAWKYSGSNEWKQEIDKDGIKVYSRKTPGSVLKDIKAIRRVKTSVTVAMASFMNSDCAEFMEGCLSGKDIVPWNPKDLSATGLFVVDFPGPFAHREYLLKTQVSQNPTTRVTLMDVTAVPDLVPRNRCCYRIEDMRNSWRFTPLGNGELEVEFNMHMDQGLPYPMVNRMAPRFTHEMFADLPRHFGKEKFQGAKLAYIKE